MTYALDSHQKLVLRLLDFDKAYGRVSWTFSTTQSHNGFLWSLDPWIEELYLESVYVIQINGSCSQPIDLQCSVRQGCTIAPYLFLLVANVLEYAQRPMIWNSRPRASGWPPISLSDVRGWYGFICFLKVNYPIFKRQRKSWLNHMQGPLSIWLNHIALWIA